MITEKARVIQKMRDILQANHLNKQEIIALLHSGDVDYTDERLGNAACQISGLLLREKVSIEEAAMIISACYKAEIDSGSHSGNHSYR